MSTNIGGMVFFEWLLKDGEIKPDSGDKILQQEDGELSDDASQFTTDTINDTEYTDISDNLADRPSDEDPPEEISEGGQDVSQTGVTAVENPNSDTISENALPCSEKELQSCPGS